MSRKMNAIAKKLSFVYSMVMQGSHLTISHIISTIYKKNLQIQEKRKLLPYHQMNPTLLWFINTEKCERRLALMYFTNRFAFGYLSSD